MSSTPHTHVYIERDEYIYIHIYIYIYIYIYAIAELIGELIFFSFWQRFYLYIIRGKWISIRWYVSIKYEKNLIFEGCLFYIRDLPIALKMVRKKLKRWQISYINLCRSNNSVFLILYYPPHTHSYVCVGVLVYLLGKYWCLQTYI